MQHEKGRKSSPDIIDDSRRRSPKLHGQPDRYIVAGSRSVVFQYTLTAIRRLTSMDSTRCLWPTPPRSNVQQPRHLQVHEEHNEPHPRGTGDFVVVATGASDSCLAARVEVHAVDDACVQELPIT